MGGKSSKLGQSAVSSVQRKLQPLASDEIAALKRFTEQDQQRMRDLPSHDQLAARDPSLDGLLSKLGGTVLRSEPSAAGVPQSLRQRQVSLHSPAEKAGVSAAPEGVIRARGGGLGEQPTTTGRAQPLLLQALFTAKSEAEASSSPLDLEQFAKEHGLPLDQLHLLFQHNCVPIVGKVATFGHQYAFARPPQWFRKQLGGAPVGRQRFKSEPGGAPELQPADKSAPQPQIGTRRAA